MSSPTPFSPEETRFAEMVFPEQANHYGALFAGSALALLSKAAFVAAKAWSRSGTNWKPSASGVSRSRSVAASVSGVIVAG